MPKFFFDISDGRLTADTVGSECEDVPTARRRAMNIAADLVKSEADFSEGHYAVLVEVRESGGRPVETIRLVIQASRIEDFQRHKQ